MAQVPVDHRPRLIALAILVIGASIAAVIACESPPHPARAVSKSTIKVVDARPLAEALNVFAKQHGVRVTYEDPRYARSNEIIDVGPQVRRSGTGPVWIPKGGPLTVVHTVPEPGMTDSEIVSILNEFVAAHRDAGYSWDFEVRPPDGSLFHVVPKTLLNADRAGTSHSSPLDAQVTLPAIRFRSAFEALEELFNAVEAGTGQKIWIATVPTNLFMQTRVEGPFAHQPARRVLAGILGQTGRRLSWRLLYDPGMKSYAFNVVW